MVAFLVLVVLALVFGIGALVKGLLWLVLIAVLLTVGAVLAGRQWFRNRL